MFTSCIAAMVVLVVNRPRPPGEARRRVDPDGSGEGVRRRARMATRWQGFPSGQRGRAVNPLAQPSEVRILSPASLAGEPMVPPRTPSFCAATDQPHPPCRARLRSRSRATLLPLALLAQSVEHLHGKEGVDGSSPSEGFRFLPAQPPFLLPVLTADRCFDVHAASTGVHGANSSGLSASSNWVACSRPSRTRWP
jgi:hypothetical protein